MSSSRLSFQSVLFFCSIICILLLSVPVTGDKGRPLIGGRRRVTATSARFVGHSQGLDIASKVRAGAMSPATWQQTLRAGVHSGSIMFLADMVTQMGLEKRTWLKQKDETTSSKILEPTQQTYDPLRSLRWGVAGLTLHGPYFYRGFHMLDRQLGAAKSFGNVMKKTAAAQLILFPPYLVGLFSYIGVMEGQSCDNIVQKVKTGVPKAFQTGCVFWPIANSINFALVPPTLRVPFVASSAGLWNCYLSWFNNKQH
jgi:hypothetical protein